MTSTTTLVQKQIPSDSDALFEQISEDQTIDLILKSKTVKKILNLYTSYELAKNVTYEIKTHIFASKVYLDAF